jgi:hypothetical protein
MLHCGHSFCSKCLTGLIKKGAVQCPYDQQSTPCTDVTALPKNFALMSQMGQVKQPTPAPVPTPVVPAVDEAKALEIEAKHLAEVHGMR